MKYLILIEKSENNYCAHIPDVPGCAATGKTKKAAKSNLAHALSIHLRSMVEDGEPVPAPETEADYIEFTPEEK